MKFSFDQQSSKEIVSKLEAGLEGRKLGDIVDFQTLENGDLEVFIKKMGTSTLRFGRKEEAGKVCFELEKEKIALTHRVFKDDITQKIIKLIENCGGKSQP